MADHSNPLSAPGVARPRKIGSARTSLEKSHRYNYHPHMPRKNGKPKAPPATSSVVRAGDTYTFTVRIHPADPDETGFWVDVPALPGCVTQGETYDEAIEMARDAIEGHLEMLRKLGEPIPIETNPPKKVAVAVRLRRPQKV
jgi:predicted RNase H-like HicB family nuclease